MPKPKILIQLDPDAQPSVFDAVVAVDSEVDHLFRHHSVSLDDVTNLVHGAMFTRGPADLHNTAIFIGGSDVLIAEAMLKKVTDTFFGPIRVSVMMDASGANTTASAAVVAASRHLDLQSANAVVLGATGPVGQRVSRLLALAGAQVKLGSRSMDRAETLVNQLSTLNPAGTLTPVVTSTEPQLREAVEGNDLIVAAGAAGIELLPAEIRTNTAAKVAIDLNAVPPAGIGGIGVTDNAKAINGQILYGAIGVGAIKMQIHKAAIRMLFDSNEVILDIDEIYRLGRKIAGT